MGLSAISTTLRRRFTSAKPVKHPETPNPSLTGLLSRNLLSSHKAAKDNDKASMRRLRLKDLSAVDLIDALSSMNAPVEADLATAVADHIASDDPLFSEIVQLAFRPPSISAPPRERLQRTWVVATLLRHGPPVLREKLATNRDLIHSLAAVFNPAPGSLDPALASFASAVISELLHTHPKETAVALYSTKLVRRLVAHIYLRPAASLLPRLVGHRVFTSLLPAPVVPMHKRGIVFLGKENVQDLLAERFVKALKARKNASGKAFYEAVAVMEGCCSAMLEISVRAMSIPRKHEEPDERADCAYAGNLGLITSAMYNDAKDAMDLWRNTKPLVRVLSIALTEGKDDPDVLLPVLGMVKAVVAGLHDARTSPLPSLRKAVANADTFNLGSELANFSVLLSELLPGDGPVVGRIRLAAVDLFREICSVLDGNSLSLFLATENFLPVERLFSLALTFRKKEMLVLQVSNTIGALLESGHPVAEQVLRHTRLTDVLNELRAESGMEKALEGLVAWDSREEASLVGRKRQQIDNVTSFYESHVKKPREGGLVSADMKRSSVSTDMVREVSVEGQVRLGEDHGQDVYVHGMIDEVGRGKTSTPPSDNVVAHAVQSNPKRWTKGLSHRLHHLHIPHPHVHGHGFRHSLDRHNLDRRSLDRRSLDRLSLERFRGMRRGHDSKH